MIKIKGVDSLTKKLMTLADAEIESIIKESTKAVLADAKSICPTNKNWHKNAGQLRNSIHAKVEKNGESVRGVVYTDKEYAAYVEFGTGRKGQASNYPVNLGLTYADYNWTFPNPDNPEERIWTSGQAAQPYMYPALERNKSKITVMIKQALQQTIGKITK